MQIKQLSTGETAFRVGFTRSSIFVMLCLVRYVIVSSFSSRSYVQNTVFILGPDEEHDCILKTL